MYRTALFTALLIGALLKRSEKNRIRLSDKTMRALAKRENLRSAFIRDVQFEAMEIGIVLVELGRGGFAAMWAASLEGAPAILAKDYIPASERKKLTEQKLWEELGLAESEAEE